MYQKKSRKRRPTAEEIEAIMAFYGINEDKPRTMYNETYHPHTENPHTGFVHTARRPKVTITQTVIEF